MDRVLAVLADPKVGGLMVTLAGLAIADLITAVGAALRGGHFEPLMIAEFLRTHIMGRLVPIVALIALSTFAQPLLAVAGLGAAAYTAETLASIKANIDLANDVVSAGPQG